VRTARLFERQPLRDQRLDLALFTHQSVIKTTFLLYMTASGAISAG
jgi:hypothetical protein